MGSGLSRAVAQHPVRLLEGRDKEVYLALVSGCAPSCAGCGWFAHSIDAGMASHHIPSVDRIVLPGAVPRWKTSSVLGMEEEGQEDLILYSEPVGDSCIYQKTKNLLCGSALVGVYQKASTTANFLTR